MDIYDTQVLSGVIATLPPGPQQFWLNNFFPNQQNFTQEWIMFDQIAGTRRMAPFVAPTASGKPIMAVGFKAERFKPAYIKPKSIIDVQRIIKRRAGEGLNGSMSLEERRQAVIAQELQEHKDQIARRLEWMACEAIVKGKVTVVGDDYPSTLVDFGRDASLTVVLSGTALWSDTTNSDPIGNIETWGQNMFALSGVVPDVIIMGLAAWGAYRKHPAVLAQANLLLRGTTGSVNIGPVFGQVFQQVATVGEGNIPIWIYNDIYEDNTGALVSYLSQDSVVVASRAGLGGFRCFGAILDPRAGYQAIDIYSKQWISEDPPAEYIMSQSAPLMVPTRPNASMVAKVV